MLCKSGKTGLGLALACLGLLIALAGCGGSGSTEATATASAPGISKAAFIRKANAICERASKEYLPEAMAALTKQTSTHPASSVEEVEMAVTARLFEPTFIKELEEVRALGLPSGDEETIESILDEVESIVKKSRTDAKWFHDAQLDFKHPFARARAEAEAYGIGPCGQP
ncbi:MAG: hypothetical protein JST31_05385 [Actinobacteria bacterium]|nr:hypothetical protein [Actinomycetota bacterium]